jgi:hypothetical protein
LQTSCSDCCHAKQSVFPDASGFSDTNRKLLESKRDFSALVVTQPYRKHGQPQGGKYQLNVAGMFVLLASMCINKIRTLWEFLFYPEILLAKRHIYGF